MEPSKRGTVTGNLHEAARKGNAEIDAALYYWNGSKPLTQAGADKAKEWLKKFGNTPPK
jgi:hypothetical protein